MHRNMLRNNDAIQSRTLYWLLCAQYYIMTIYCSLVASRSPEIGWIGLIYFGVHIDAFEIAQNVSLAQAGDTIQLTFKIIAVEVYRYWLKMENYWNGYWFEKNNVTTVRIRTTIPGVLHGFTFNQFIYIHPYLPSCLSHFFRVVQLISDSAVAILNLTQMINSPPLCRFFCSL